MIDVSIIFVNYKTEEYLFECLKSVQQFTSQITLEYIVADNRFVEGNNEQIVSAFPYVKWINAGDNVGFSKANNIGAQHATGKYLLFLNCDTLLFDNAIFNAFSFLENNPNYAALGGIQLDSNKNAIPFYHSLNDVRKDFYFIPQSELCKKILLRLLPKENFSLGETNNLVGAFIMISKEVFFIAGQWDEDFFMYAEDAELSFRLSKLGKIGYIKDVQFIHLIKGNEYTRANDSWANRFSVQIQVSNFLWLRKSYGIIPLLLIYLNYAIFLPIFWFWKICRNVIEGKKFLEDTYNQKMLTKKIGILFKYLPKYLFLKHQLFKILPEENIGNK